MAIEARYAHTNIVAQDWRKLAGFYEEVFGCVRVPPERRHRGAWLERATGVSGAEVDGVHLRLPGHGEAGPTLEIFSYNRPLPHQGPAVNRQGLAHLAFEVDDVPAARRAIHAAGGRDYAEPATVHIPDAGIITLIYVTDPEGNVIELQSWEK